MRLFYAVNFTAEFKEKAMDSIKALEGLGVFGRPVQRDNIHLTLAFLGEAEPEHAKKAMEGVSGAPFTLTFHQLGHFWQKDGALVYLAASKSRPLYSLQKNLVSELKKAGFALDPRPFRPHLTLFRQAVIPSALPASPIGKLTAQVSGFSLMLSERNKGVLTYTPLYTKLLEGQAL